MPSNRQRCTRRAALTAGVTIASALAGCQALDDGQTGTASLLDYNKDAPIDGDSGPWPTTRAVPSRRAFTPARIGPSEDNTISKIAPASTEPAPAQPAISANGVLLSLSSDARDNGDSEFDGIHSVSLSGREHWQRAGSGDTYAAIGNAAYVPTGPGITVVDTRNGSTCWTFDAGRYPTPAGDVLCLEASDRLYGLDVTTGDVVWQSENFGGDAAFEYTLNAFAATPDLLVGTRDLEYEVPSVVAIDPSNGSVNWRGDVDPSPFPPVIGPDRVYVLTDTETLHAFSHDGTHQWARAASFASPPAVSNSLLHATTTAAPRASVALDPATGDEVWRTTVGERASHVPAVTPERAFVVTAGKTEPVAITALDASSGAVVWRSELGTSTISLSHPITPPALAKDHLVLMTDNDRNNRSSGTYSF